MPKKIVIIGKNSYLGGFLANYLTQAGFSVSAYSSRNCDFLDYNQVYTLFQSYTEGVSYTVIFLAVINKHTDNSYRSFQENVQIVRNFIGGIKQTCIDSVLYFSSVDVYGNNPKLPITEDSQINPDTWYGLAKYMCEWQLLQSGELNCPVTIVRIPGVFGKALHEKSIIGKLVQCIHDDKEIALVSSGKMLRNYVWLHDVGRVIAELLPMRHEGVLNLVTDKSTSIRDIAMLIGEVLGVKFNIVDQLAANGRSFDLVFDNRRLLELLPNFRFSDLRTGLESYL